MAIRKTTIKLIVLSDDEAFNIENADLGRIIHECDEGAALLHSLDLPESIVVTDDEARRLSVEAGSDETFFFMDD